MRPCDDDVYDLFFQCFWSKLTRSVAEEDRTRKFKKIVKYIFCDNLPELGGTLMSRGHARRKSNRCVHRKQPKDPPTVPFSWRPFRCTRWSVSARPEAPLDLGGSRGAPRRRICWEPAGRTFPGRHLVRPGCCAAAAVIQCRQTASTTVCSERASHACVRCGAASADDLQHD